MSKQTTKNKKINWKNIGNEKGFFSPFFFLKLLFLPSTKWGNKGWIKANGKTKKLRRHENKEYDKLKPTESPTAASSRPYQFLVKWEKNKAALSASKNEPSKSASKSELLGQQLTFRYLQNACSTASLRACKLRRGHLDIYPSTISLLPS